MQIPESRDQLQKRWQTGEEIEFFFFYGHKPPAQGVDASCLSQWFERAFVIDGIEYLTAEHWMMAEKARLFEDEQMLGEILNSLGAREAKACGRKVTNFDNALWNEHKYEIVKRGNLAKFSQHDDLKSFLLSTTRCNSNDEQKTKTDSVDDDSTKQTDSVDSQKSIVVRENVGRFRVEGKGEKPSNSIGSYERSNEHESLVVLVEAAGRDTVWGIGLGQNNPKAQDPFTWRGQNLLGFALTSVRQQLLTNT